MSSTKYSHVTMMYFSEEPHRAKSWKVWNIYTCIYLYSSHGTILENIGSESDLLFSKRTALQRTLLTKISYSVIYHGGISETTALNSQCHTSPLWMIQWLQKSQKMHKTPQIHSFFIFPVAWVTLPSRKEPPKSNFGFTDFRAFGV